MTNKKKKTLYYLLFILVCLKVVSLNFAKIKENFMCLQYNNIVGEYESISHYSKINDIKGEIKAIYFGSKDCIHCIDSIKNTKVILKDMKKIYYFNVNFNNWKNQEELEKFKNAYGFETIPHIIIFEGDSIVQYDSKKIKNHE